LLVGYEKRLHRRDIKLITEIIVHCSDSDNPDHDDIEVIRSWHKARGFTDIGYHFFLKTDGTIQPGRKINQIGAHCTTQNVMSIGICLAGRHDFTEAQFSSVYILIKKLMENYSILKKNVVPHHVFNENKTCPNFPLDNIWKFENLA
jgi:hypothetical protein